MNLANSNKRLLKLADYLEQLPRGAINMEGWLTDKNRPNYTRVRTTVANLGNLAKVNGNKIELKATSVDKIRECGYAACAVGWACTIPSFKKAGLKLQSKVLNGIDDFRMVPKYKSYAGFDAAMSFFGVDQELATYLFESDAFGDSAKPRPSTVARRIRKVVARRAAGKPAVPTSSVSESFNEW